MRVFILSSCLRFFGSSVLSFICLGNINIAIIRIRGKVFVKRDMKDCQKILGLIDCFVTLMFVCPDEIIWAFSACPKLKVRR